MPFTLKKIAMRLRNDSEYIPLPGVHGEDGADGVSPAVSFTTITGGHTMTVTDKDHPSGQSINIMDGSSSSLTILSYGHSTWNDFITAYNSNSIVYCRASSAADPSSGSQTRLAFMAYVNSAASPTSVEFQYYRSVSSHSDSQQGDQVYIYKLTSAGVWSVTVREAYTKIAAGSNMTSSYANGTLTLNATGGGTADALPLAGGTMEGDIDMDGNAVTGLPTPTANSDAVPKSYADMKYTKPSSGIPASDLASAVQTSLGLADSALQSVPSTYRTAAAQDAIDALFSAYKRTNNNLVCFGDSWTVGTGIAVADRPTKRFTAIVAKKLLCTEYNFGVGAAGFIRSGNLFSTQINTANSQMTTEQKENTGVVLIVGGVNDYRQQLTTSTLAQFVEGVVSTANLAHSIFPNALIVLGIGNTNLSYFPEKARQWYSAAISACEHQLEYPSLVIKNLYNVISGNTSMYSSDNLHPNESGHGKFGGYIANAILGGGQSVFSALGTVTLSSGVALDGSEGPTELTLWRVNDEIVVGAARFTFSPAITSAKVIGTIPTKSAPPSNAYYPFYNSDQNAGNIAITASGNMYLIPATGVSSLSSGFNQQLRYMFGKPTNTDES